MCSPGLKQRQAPSWSLQVLWLHRPLLLYFFSQLFSPFCDAPGGFGGRMCVTRWRGWQKSRRNPAGWEYHADPRYTSPKPQNVMSGEEAGPQITHSGPGSARPTLPCTPGCLQHPASILLTHTLLVYHPHPWVQRTHCIGGHRPHCVTKSGGPAPLIKDFKPRAAGDTPPWGHPGVSSPAAQSLGDFSPSQVAAFGDGGWGSSPPRWGKQQP